MNSVRRNVEVMCSSCSYFMYVTIALSVIEFTLKSEMPLFIILNSTLDNLFVNAYNT